MHSPLGAACSGALCVYAYQATHPLAALAVTYNYVCINTEICSNVLTQENFKISIKKVAFCFTLKLSKIKFTKPLILITQYNSMITISFIG